MCFPTVTEYVSNGATPLKFIFSSPAGKNYKDKPIKYLKRTDHIWHWTNLSNPCILKSSPSLPHVSLNAH